MVLGSILKLLLQATVVLAALLQARDRGARCRYLWQSLIIRSQLLHGAVQRRLATHGLEDTPDGVGYNLRTFKLDSVDTPFSDNLQLFEERFKQFVLHRLPILLQWC